MNDTVKDALRIAQRPMKPLRFHQTIKRRGYQDGGGPAERTSEPSAAPHGVVDMGDKIIVGYPHGEKLDLPEDLRQRINDVAAQHGAWYEGTGGDKDASAGLVPSYKGSWDDQHAASIKGYPVEYLAPMFSNVEVNKPYEMYADPKKSIMASLIANQDKAKYFNDRRYDEKALRDFLKAGSEADVDFLKMSQQPATKDNLRKFFTTGESLMWPENWQEYPNNLGKMAKRFEEGRNRYLLDAPPGVYVTGAGHIPELQSMNKDLKVIGGERAAKDEGGPVAGVPDEASREKFLHEQLQGSAPQQDDAAGELTAKRAGLFGAGLLPGSGIASATGNFPTAEGGYEPSMRENWKQGNYGTWAMQGLGAAGDVAQAIPVVGTAAGAVMKAPLAAKLAMAAVPAAKGARELMGAAKAAEEAAPVAKAVEEAAPALTKTQSQAAMQQAWQEGRGDTANFKNWNHQWNIQEKPKYEQAKVEAPAVQTAPAAPQEILPYKEGYTRLVNPAGFYSRAHEVAMNELPEGARQWREMRDLMTKEYPTGPRVNEQEMYWSGLHKDAFPDEHKITRDEIAALVQKNFPMVEPVIKGGGLPKEYVAAKEAADASHQKLKGALNAYDEVAQQAHAATRDDPNVYIPTSSALFDKLSYGGEHARRAIADLPENLRPAAEEALAAYQEHRPLYEEANRLRKAIPPREPTKWEQHTVPGGTDYQERILTIPHVDTSDIHPDVRTKYDPVFEDLQTKIQDLQQQREDFGVQHRTNVVNPYIAQLRDEYTQKLIRDGEARGEKLTTREELDAAYADLHRHDAEVEKANQAVQEAWANARAGRGDTTREAQAAYDAAEKARNAAEDHYDDLSKRTLEATRKHVDSYGPTYIARQLGKENEFEALKNPPEFEELNNKIAEHSRLSDETWNKMQEESNARLSEGVPGYATQDPFYHTAHLGDIANPLLHTRAKTRVGPNGEKIFHVDEAQSDLAQQGAKKGFHDPAVFKKSEDIKQQQIDLERARREEDQRIRKEYDQAHRAANPEYYRLTEEAMNQLKNSRQLQSDIERYNDAEMAARQHLTMEGDMAEAQKNKALKELYDRTEAQKAQLQAQLDALPKNGPIPLFPHAGALDQWTKLAAKDIVSHALESGHNRIAITGAQEQAKRWSNQLRQAVDNVRWESPQEDTWKGFGTPEEQAAATNRYARAKDNFYRARYGDSNYDAAELEFREAEEAMRDIVPGWGRAEGSAPVLASEGQRTVYATPKGGGREHRFVVQMQPHPTTGKPRPTVVDTSISEARNEPLSAVVGEDLAKRIMAEEAGDVPMHGYRMGSQGYEQIYESALPKEIATLLKRLHPDVKREMGALHMDPAVRAEVDNMAQRNFARDWDELSPEDQEKMRYQLNDEQKYAVNPAPVTYIDLSPQHLAEYKRLKDKFGSVWPAYKRGGPVKRKDRSGLRRYALDLSRRITRDNGGPVGGVPGEASKEKFLHEQLQGSAPQYVEQNDIPARAARAVEGADRAVGAVNNALASAAGMSDAFKNPMNRSASEIATAYIPPDPNEVSKQATQQWAQGDRLGAAETMVGGMPQTGMFVGPKSVGWSEKAVDNAKALKEAGVDKENVLHQTGLHVTPKNEWWSEISDQPSQARITQYIMDKDKAGHDVSNLYKEGFTENLPTLFHHPELYEKYPFLSEMPVNVMGEGKLTDYGGQYNPTARHINLSGRLIDDSNAARSVLLHEIMHAIQHKEGTAFGTNIEAQAERPSRNPAFDRYYAAKNDPDHILNRHDALWDDPEHDRQMLAHEDWWATNVVPKIGEMKNKGVPTDDIMDFVSEATKEANEKFPLYAERRYLRDRLRGEGINPIGPPMEFLSPEEGYFASAGEAQARNVQHRADLPEENLRTNHPENSVKYAYKGLPFRDQVWRPIEGYKRGGIVDYALDLTRKLNRRT